MRCEHCLTLNYDHYKFCRICGRPMVSAKSVPQTEYVLTKTHNGATQRLSPLARQAPMSASLTAILATVNSVLAFLLLLFSIACLAFTADTMFFSVFAIMSFLFFLPMALLRVSSAVSHWLLFRGIKAGPPHSTVLSGLTILKITKIISCVLCLLTLFIASIFANIETFSDIVNPPYYRSSSYITDEVFACLAIIAAFVMTLLYYLSYLRTIRSMRQGLQSGEYRHASIYTIVCNFILVTIYACYLVFYAITIPSSEPFVLFLFLFALMFYIVDCVYTAMFLCSYNVRRKRM